MYRAIAFAVLILLAPTARGASDQASWDQPAAALADQVAAILGPGQARLTIRNLSTIKNDQIPAIRRLLEEGLRAHGIADSGDEAANLVRVTLSENARQRLWVAEVVEGTESHAVMIGVNLPRQTSIPAASGITLRKQMILTSHEPILAALETSAGLVTLEPEQIRTYAHSAAGWTPQTAYPARPKRSLARDSRGILATAADGWGFQADLPGLQCDGTFASNISNAQWSVHCRDSDDPWPVEALSVTPGGINPALKAFYNSTRDYFTGIVVPSQGVDLPPFYAAAWIPRGSTPGLLINGIDGKLQVVQNGDIKPVSGGRDWGSDFAAIASGCDSGIQIIASGSGPGGQDSLRAYNLPALEAIPASAPLAVDGSIAALWTAPDGKSVVAIVRSAIQHGQSSDYEVDRVTATCN